MKLSFKWNDLALTIQHTAEIVSAGALYVLVALLPVFFLPITADFFDFQKQTLIFIFAAVIIVAFAVKTFVTKMVRITITPMTLPGLGFLGALLLSLFLASPYAYESLEGRGLMFASLVISTLLLPSLVKRVHTTALLMCASISMLVATALSVLEQFGYGPIYILNTVLKLQLNTQGLFHPAGSVFVGAVLLVPLALAHGIAFVTSEKRNTKILHGVLGGLVAASLAFHIFLMLPNKPARPTFLPFDASWSIAVDTMKNPKTAMLGVGPESYSTAFTQLRPASLNLLANIWNIRFSAARTEFLHILTTLGMIGFFAFGIYIISVVRLTFPLKKSTLPIVLFLGVCLVEFALFPANLLQYAFFFLFVGIFTIIMKEEKDDRISDILFHLFAIKLVAPESPARPEKHLASQAFTILIAVAMISLVGTVGYVYANLYVSEVQFFQSLQATQKNDGLKAYNLQSAVVARTPLLDRFRRAFASTNFLIADALARNPQVTQEDKNNIPQLIQQSIREAKAATELDPRKTANWETLSTIYRTLINVAQGADQWTVAAYVRAIQTDPTNPSLRLDLGGVYLATQNYEQAIRMFQQASELKPDWANAQYNLSNAYKQKGDNKLALEALKAALALLPANSDERAKVQQEIDTLTAVLKNTSSSTPAAPAEQTQPKKSTTKAPASTPQSLSTPSTQRIPEGQIRLPADLGLESPTP